ncbi:Hypothetical predicted protein, partial [Olea europaea subsp. europaea]
MAVFISTNGLYTTIYIRDDGVFGGGGGGGVVGGGLLRWLVLWPPGAWHDGKDFPHTSRLCECFWPSGVVEDGSIPILYSMALMVVEVVVVVAARDWISDLRNKYERVDVFIGFVSGVLRTEYGKKFKSWQLESM